MDNDSDDDIPQLSAHALAALQEFYAEREQQDVSTVQDGAAQGTVEEDWQLSQFWYDERTAETLALEALRVSQNKRIVCISCPTLYSKLLEIKPPECEVLLLEYDRRFETYGEDYVFYDYNKPLELPQKLVKNSFDLVVADPPYLSEECLRKTSETIKFLAKDSILLCTGAIMEELASQILGVRKCSFIPKHKRNLANEFRCFTNYKSELNSTCTPEPYI